MTDEWSNLAETEDSDDGAYFRTDEFNDVLSSLKLLSSALERVDFDPDFWKWVILSSHSALQGACVCILTHTDGLGALADKATEELMHKLYGEANGNRNLDDDEVRWPKEFIAPLTDLLKRLPGDLAVVLPKKNSAPYPWDQAGDLLRLHEFRNKLVHFAPSSWSLELAGTPRIVLAAIELVERISKSSEYRRYNRFEEIDLDTILQQIKSSLERVTPATKKQNQNSMP